MEKLTDIKQIAKEVRNGLKLRYPGLKWSIRIEKYSMGRSLHVALMSGPFDAFKESERGYRQINHYYLDRNMDELNPEALEAIKTAYALTQVHNWDNSEPMTDYFDVNFYVHITVGQWNKQYINTNKRET